MCIRDRYALNEIDAKLVGGVVWRSKLESQRGAVLATELKNNSNKLAKWTLQVRAAAQAIAAAATAKPQPCTHNIPNVMLLSHHHPHP